MTCAKVLAEISAYYDGELDPARRDMVASHLADCPKCSAYLADLAQIREMLRSDRVCAVPEQMWGRIAAATQHSASPRRLRLSRWAARAAAVAAGFVLYLFGYGAMTSSLDLYRPGHLADADHVEWILNDTGSALAGSSNVAEPPRLFENGPEARFLSELLKDARP